MAPMERGGDRWPAKVSRMQCGYRLPPSCCWRPGPPRRDPGAESNAPESLDLRQVLGAPRPKTHLSNEQMGFAPGLKLCCPCPCRRPEHPEAMFQETGQ